MPYKNMKDQVAACRRYRERKRKRLKFLEEENRMLKEHVFTLQTELAKAIEQGFISEFWSRNIKTEP